MAKHAGKAEKLYRGTAGSTATTLMDNVADVTFDTSAGEIDVTTRGSGGWADYIDGVKDGTLTFRMFKDSDDADYQAVRAAYLAGTPLAFLVADDTGAGWDLDCKVMGFSDSAPIADAAAVEVTCRPNCATRNPSWHTPSTGTGT